MPCILEVLYYSVTATSNVWETYSFTILQLVYVLLVRRGGVHEGVDELYLARWLAAVLQLSE
jgi:hypothetical protein